VGDYAKAAELYQSALKSWEQVEDKPSKITNCRSNYADLLRSAGQVRKAHQLEGAPHARNWPGLI